MPILPAPQIADCYYEDVFQPRVSAMHLRWEGLPEAEQSHFWKFPEGITLQGPVARGFGIHILRHHLDSYAVHIVWNQTHLAWNSLTRRHLLESCIGPLLEAMGTDLQYLLDQPISSGSTYQIEQGEDWGKQSLCAAS
jgi:hypothetical protein